MLVDARKNDPPTYRVLLKEINIDEKGKHLSQNQKQLIAKKANELQQRQYIESKDGMFLYTEAEFIHHWKGRIRLNEKDAIQLYVKESNAVDAVWGKKRGTWLLGVWKPPEVNANEILSRNVGIKSGGTMKSLMNSAAAKKITSSLGSGLKNGWHKGC